MKKLLIISLVLLFCASAYGIPVGADRAERGAFTGPRESTSQEANIKSALAFLLAKNGMISTGSVWYVNSNVDGETGVTLATAVGTIEEADVLSAADGGANRGDIIVVLPGHDESITAGSLNLSTAGIRVFGFGNGSLMPKLSYDISTGTVIVTGNDIVIDGIWFMSSVTAVVNGLIISGADDVVVRNCRFVSEGDALTVDEFNTAIMVRSTSDRTMIDDCWFNARAAGAVNAVSLGSVSGFRMKNTTIFGNYSAACVIGYQNFSSSRIQTVPTEVIITNSIMFNGTMGGDGEINTVKAFHMPEGAGGYVAENRFISAAVSEGHSMFANRTGDDMVFMNNMSTSTDGDEYSGGLESGTTLISLSPGSG